MTKTTFSLFVFLFSSVSLFAQAGKIDSSFNEVGIVDMQVNDARSIFYTVLVQPDQKIVAIGSVADTLNLQAIAARFNPDGTLDDSFGNGGIYQTLNDWPYVFGDDGMLLPDGKLMIFADVAYQNELALIRLLPNGTQDSTFGINGFSSAYVDFTYYSPIPLSGFAQGDGKFILVGFYEDFSSGLRRGFAMRFLADGTPDDSFSDGSFATFLPPAQNQDWEVVIHSGIVQEDGKIVLVGSLGKDEATRVWYIVRLMPDGSFDTSFDNDGIVTANIGNTFSEAATAVLLLPGGKILAGGYGQKLPGQHFTLMRFNANGAVDNSFGLGGKAQLDFGCCHSYIRDLVLQPDGKIVASGESDADGVHRRFSVGRFKPNGGIDLEFGDQGKVIVPIDHNLASATARSVALQQDGKIVLSGGVLNPLDDYGQSGLVVRLNPGTIVSTATPYPLLDNTLTAQPNPLSGRSLTLTYDLDRAGEVQLELYDFLGRPLSTLMESTWKAAGTQTEQVKIPQDLPAGEYLLKLNTAWGVQTSKLILVD